MLYKIFTIAMAITVFMIVIAMMSNCVNQIIALIKGDHLQFARLTTPRDIAGLMARRDFGVSEEEFEKKWNELSKEDPRALPYDVYVYFRDRK